MLDEVQLTQDLTYLGLETVIELATLYQDTSQVHFDNLFKDDSLNNRLLKDGVDIGHILHALKGSSANMGLGELSKQCKALEKSGLTLSEYQASELEMLKVLWQASIAQLQAWIEQQKSERNGL
ncbi:Hpt domain-containing protein [Psychrobacter sp. 1Y1]|uniref:Hpt domain-containing protein n=1 Tax=Psychrobacter sp. 1Y1 TaxID=3453574 RepID=UPI003F4459CD